MGSGYHRSMSCHPLCEDVLMIGNFNRCFDLVIAHEKGYVNNPLDSGGPTKYGVTRETLADWRKTPVTVDSVKNLTAEEAKEIYQSRYWNTMRCDLLPDGLDYAAFDAAVNSGTYQASKWLQKALGVKIDGVLGPVTMKAVERCSGLVVGSILELCSQRLRFVLSLNSPTEEAFERGWGIRILQVLQVATLMNERNRT